MTSNINYSTINENYPVAGQDNDTQTFRDNFNSIKSNFEVTSTEITDLQTNVVRKDTTNDLALNVISNAVLQNNRNQTFDGGAVPILNQTGATSIDFMNGPYQIFRIGPTTTGSPLLVTLDNFPGDASYTAEISPIGVGSMMLELYSDGSPRNINFTTSNGTTIKKNSSFPIVVPLTDVLTTTGSGTYKFYPATATASTTLGSGGASGTNTFVVSSATGIVAGQLVTGTGVPANTYVSNSYTTGTTITLVNSSNTAQNFTVNAAGDYKFFTAVATTTATGTSGGAALVVASATGIATGQFVLGTGIAAATDPSGINGTQVQSFTAGNPVLSLTSSTDPVFVEIWRHNLGTIFMHYHGTYS